MRCINCGFSNDPGRSTCAQCGQPLSGDNYGPQLYQQPASPVGDYQKTSAFDQAQRTRIISAGEISALSQDTDERKYPDHCPKCSYPVLEGYNICPNCGTELRKGAATANTQDVEVSQTFPCDTCGKEVSVSYSFCPSCGSKLHLPTVNFNTRRRKGVKAEPLPEHKCSLTLIPEDDEDVEAICNDYKGPKVQLTRENTEPKNRTITSKGQALLECDDDGQWYITNQSEQGTTIIQVTRKTPIQDGDIIMLGDRSFRFEVKE